jgi:hypothetical protein
MYGSVIENAKQRKEFLDKEMGYKMVVNNRRFRQCIPLQHFVFCIGMLDKKKILLVAGNESKVQTCVGVVSVSQMMMKLDKKYYTCSLLSTYFNTYSEP